MIQDRASRPLIFVFLLLLPTVVASPADAQEAPDAVKRPIWLDSLVVSVYRLPVAIGATSSSVTVLDGRELEARNVGTVLDALRTVPGLAVSQSGSWGSTASVYFRGGESDYVGVVIDGVQVNEPGGRYDFAHLTVEQIDRIEIVRGPASTMYGSDAVSGVIRIFTRTGEGSSGATATVQGGTYNSWRGSIALSSGGDLASYGLALSVLRTDGIRAFNNNYENASFSGLVKLTPDQRTDLSLSARYRDHTFHFPTDGGGAAVDENQYTFGDELTLGLDARRQLSDAVDLALLFGVHDNETGVDDLPDGTADTLGFYSFQSLDDVRRLSADVRVSLALSPTVAGFAGAELEEQRSRSFSESQSEFGPSSAFGDHERSNAAYYGHLLGRWGGLALNGSLRVEDNEAFGRLVSYSGGAAYRPARTGTKLRASVGRGIKEPSLLENFATGFARGNPDLDPEQSFSWEVGLDTYLVNRRIRIAATYFDQSFGDLIQFTFTPPDPEGPSYFNVAAADVTGAEMEVNGVLGAFTVSAGYTWINSEVTDAGFDEGEDATFVDGERLLRRPAHQASVGVRRQFGQADASHDRNAGSAEIGGYAGLEIRHVGNRADRDFSASPAVRVTLPAHTVIDLYGEVALPPFLGDPALAVLARVENVLDEVYAEAHGFPAPGRRFWVGLRAATSGRP